MAQSEYTFKLKATGGNEVKSTFSDVAKSGDAAFKGIEQGSAGAFKYAKMAISGIAAYASVDYFVGMVKGAIDAQDELGKMAQKVGMSVEDLSKLEYSAKLSDISIEQLSAGLKKLNTGMVDAASGTGKAYDALKVMGISVKDSSGNLKTNGQILNEVADQFAKYGDGAQKSALAVAIFGKSGQEMIPMLNSGSQAIKEAGDELDSFGGVITTKAAKNAEIFNDNLTRLSTAGSVLGKSIANDVLPYLTQLTEEFLAARKNGLGFFDMLMMGFRSTDYQKQLLQIEDEINSVNKAWSFPIGPSRDDRLASLEKQKKTIIDMQTLMMKDQIAGPPKALMGINQKKDAPTLIDSAKVEKEAEKYAKGLGRAQDANDKFIASMREMAQKEQLSINSSFMSETEKKFVQDMITVNKSFLDTQAEITKQYTEGRLSIKDYNEQASILSGNYQFAADQAQNLKQKQDALNQSWSYGASRALNSYFNEASNMARNVEGSFTRMAKGMEDSIVNFVMTGQQSFTQLANSMIADMVRIMVQQSITAPLAKAGASFFAGMFGGGSGVDNITTDQWTSGNFAKGGGFDSGVQKFAKGGAFTNTIIDNPTLFKFAKGAGVMGEAGPEAIMPLSRDSSGRLGVTTNGGGAPIINMNVVNQGSADGYQASASARKNDRGFDIEVMIQKVVNSDISRNGPMSRNFAGAFGLRRGAR